MKKLKEKISEYKQENISDYFLIDKRIESEKGKRKVESEKTLRIALLSSFTSKGIKEVLNVKCCSLGILPEFYLGGYNQYAQQILDDKSALYEFSPELTIVFIDIINLFGDAFFFPYRFSDDQRRSLIDEKYNTLTVLIETLSKRHTGKVIVHNFNVPAYSPLGILEQKQDFGIAEAVRTLNSKLRERYKGDSRVYIFDYDLFCSAHGKKNLMDFKMYYLADAKISFNLMPALCEEYMGFIKPVMSLAKKCLVLDLDNTLWGGIIGEDGIEGIKLGPTPEGRPFLEFQKYILNLFERGIILAINSRNNFGDAVTVFKEHPYMILKEEHFACMKINWQDKVTNMREIAKEINIGINSLVFIDDDKANREMVKKFIPEVYVVDLPDDPSFYPQALMGINDFNSLQITEEDRKRGRMYVARRSRQKLQMDSPDIAEFLKGLNIKVTIAMANPFTIPRISQLTQRTNQFNTTSRRYNEEDIRKLATGVDSCVYNVKVEDKFGDEGICGVAIIKYSHQKKECVITSFLLSCRVLGREVEKAVLAFIIEQAKNNGTKVITGEFIPSEKNEPAKYIYRNNGFKLFNEDGDLERWKFDVAKSGYRYPEFITVRKEL